VCECVYVRGSRRDDGSVCNISVVCICECVYVCVSMCMCVIAGGTTVLCAT